MTLDEKNVNIIQVQCVQSCFSTTLTKFLSLGKCTALMQRNSILIDTIIKILKRFEPFKSKVYNAQEIVFTKGTETADVTITFVLDGNTFTYTGENNVESINNYFITEINNLNGKYIAILDNSVFYIYSYSNTENFTIVPTVTITPDIPTSQTLLSFLSNSLQFNLEKIVNLWNCITEEEFYKLKDKINKLTQ